MSQLTPREIVHELDKHIIGQEAAKRSVAIALRNRWRRQQVMDPLRQEITPKNILMIGPTGVGKTEIARRLAKLADAPFIKVEATKFTEVGYVGRDVDSIVRDLVESAIKQSRERETQKMRARAEDHAEERILDVLLPAAREIGAPIEVSEGESATRQKFRKKLREGELNDKEIEIEVASAPTHMEIFAPPGMEELTTQIQGMFQNLGGERKRTRKLRIREAMKLITEEEASKLVNDEELKLQAVQNVEQNGIVSKLHYGDCMRRAADTGINNQRYVGETRPHGFQRHQIERSHGATNRCAPRHQNLAARLQQLLGDDQIVGRIGKDLKTIVAEDFSGFHKCKDIGLQRIVMADDLQLDPVGAKHLARHLCR